MFFLMITSVFDDRLFVKSAPWLSSAFHSKQLIHSERFDTGVLLIILEGDNWEFSKDNQILYFFLKLSWNVRSVWLSVYGKRDTTNFYIQSQWHLCLHYCLAIGIIKCILISKMLKVTKNVSESMKCGNFNDTRVLIF